MHKLLQRLLDATPNDCNLKMFVYANAHRAVPFGDNDVSMAAAMAMAMVMLIGG